MNNDNATIATLTNEIISATYEGTIQEYAYLGSYAVFVYASLLHLPDEVEYIWKQKFTLPTYLYLLSKYPLLFYTPLIIGTASASTESLSLCNALGIVSQVLIIFVFLGVQGLISVRTYALCQGYSRPMAAVLLSVIISIDIAAQIYGTTIPFCGALFPKALRTVSLIANIMLVLLNVLAFIVVVRRVWGPWKLKRSTSLRSTEDLLTIILEQGTLRFCFILFLTITQVFISFFASTFNSEFAIFQNILSSLLICEFTVDLRRREAKKKEILNASAIDLPTLSLGESPLQSIRLALGRLHENVVAEMGEENQVVDRDNSGSNEPDDLQNGSHGINLVGPEAV